MRTTKAAVIAALTGVAIACAAPAAFAQTQADRGWYVGGSLGQSTAEDACDGLGGTGISCDDEDTAWKFFGGYQLNRNFAVELGYTNFGEISLSAFGLSETIEATAWELVGVGSFPVADRFSLYGKLGFYRAETEDRTNFGFSADETNTGLTFGIGARYDFTQTIGVRAEWQKYSDVGGGDIGESDLDVLSVGLVVRF
jgi:OOP family OmpA-OmpF porin